MDPILTVEGLSVAYGPVRAVRDLSLAVFPGEIVALLGANGAGKTTTLHALMGLTPSTGRRIFAGHDLGSSSTEDIVKMGMTLVPEGRRVFPKLTVAENLRIGGYATKGRRPEIDPLNLFPVLANRADQAAGTLSGGEQQQLAIARALMSSPRLLLLDEPSLGLAPVVVDIIFDLLADLNRQGVTLCIVEQNVNLALEISKRAYVMATGEVRIQGTSKELSESTGIERAYLGIGAA